MPVPLAEHLAAHLAPLGALRPARVGAGGGPRRQDLLDSRREARRDARRSSRRLLDEPPQARGVGHRDPRLLVGRRVISSRGSSGAGCRHADYRIGDHRGRRGWGGGDRAAPGRRMCAPILGVCFDRSSTRPPSSATCSVARSRSSARDPHDDEADDHECQSCKRNQSACFDHVPLLVRDIACAIFSARFSTSFSYCPYERTERSPPLAVRRRECGDGLAHRWTRGKILSRAQMQKGLCFEAVALSMCK